MVGLLGALAHPHPTSAAVIGLGTGSTAGWLAAVPSIGRVDVMEIEPAILKFAAQCAPVNQDALHNSKLHLLLGDARELLLTSKQKYDLIVSEPSNPYRAGIATLFTQEYYQAVAKKLEPGGFFVQWLQAYCVDTRTVQIFYATLHSVFPHIETWQTADNDLMLIGSENPISYDIPVLRERVAQEPFKSALAKVCRTTDLEGVFSHYVGNERFVQTVMRQRGVPLNTDDRTLLEFAFARNLPATSGISFDGLRRDASLFEADHPMCFGELDWESVENQRLGMFVPFDRPPQSRSSMSNEQQIIAAAFNSYANDNLADAWRHWQQLGREPRSLVELAMVAECLADQGDAKAFPYIDKLEKIEPTEAWAIEARLLWRQDRMDESGAVLEKALNAFQTDPWPVRALMVRTVNVAQRIAEENKDQATVQLLYRALEKPFAIYNIDETRMVALLHLGLDLDRGRAGEYTLRGIEAPEPNIPWQLNFLKIRSACYEHFQHPLAETAKRDLAEFMKADSDLAESKDAPVIDPRDRVASAGHY
jgi:spermidine synthase